MPTPKIFVDCFVRLCDCVSGCLFQIAAGCTIAVLLTSTTCFGESLKIGMAEVDITPPPGMAMAGYYHERLAEKTRDPLKAKAIVFRQDDQAAAFVVADLTGIAHDLTNVVRQQASAQTGIPAAHIMLSATHAHTAPDYTGQLYQYLKQSEQQRDADSYPARLIQGCVDAIVQANQRAEPVTVSAGAAEQQTPVAFNRRFVMKDGSVRTWQNMANEQVVRAAGPVDPEIGLLKIASVDNTRIVGVVSNFALHLDTVGGLEWSADYPYYIEQHLRKMHGADLISIFGAGTCGDINHSDPTRKERNKTDFIGHSLAETIQAALPELPPVEAPVLQVNTTIVNVPMQDVTPQELNRAEELIPLAKAGGKVDFFDLVSAYKAVVLDQMQHPTPQSNPEKFLTWGLTNSWAGIGKTLPVDVATITLGDDVAIVFLPGEVFVELGLAIKQASPYPTTLIVELTNCVETIYIPTRAAYAGGSYEVTNSALQPGSGEMLVEAALRLLRTSATKQP
ncbi:MAG: neutral/alkaline non-lysosomal ceramidase N-terminal domain-containing protein [Planctomycetaceae bacterium]